MPAVARTARPVRRPVALVAALTAAVVLLTGLPSAGATTTTSTTSTTSTTTGTDSPDSSPTGASSEQLHAQVRELTAQVEELEVAAEVATESWNEVRSELDGLVDEEIRAQVALDEAGEVLDADRSAATRRVRALYRSGGTVGLAWTALQGAGFAEVATTYRTARVVLDVDAATVAESGRTVDSAVDSSTRVQQLRRDRMALEAEAEARRVETEAVLQARATLLAGTDEALVAAVERERLEAERAAIAYALAQARARAEEAERAEQTRLAMGLPGADLETSTTSAGAVAGPAGGVVPPGYTGSDADQQAIVDAAAAAAPNAAAATAIRAAATRLGMPYLWGATGPSTFDCSGLTMWSYRQAGVNIPRTSRQQYAGLPRVGLDELLPGDLIFYANGSAPSSIHHVSIYLGDGIMLTAPRAGDVVKISAVWRKPVYGAVRPTA